MGGYSAKKEDGVDVYLILLLPLVVALMIIFAVSIEGDMQESRVRQIEGCALYEETMRSTILPDELPSEYSVKEMDRENLMTST